MTQTPPPGLPPSGWYPDPADPHGQRYWDGQQWTEHVAPGGGSGWGAPPGAGAPAAGGWGQPQPMSGYAPGPVQPAYGAYVPRTAPLTASGMRRVSALFTDAGRILRRAWWPILAVSLILWVVAAAIGAVVVALVVDVDRLRQAIELTNSALNRYSGGKIPASVSDEIRAAFEAVPRTSSPAVWITVGVGLLLLLMIVSAIQVVSVNRLGMDAAAGREVSMGAAFRSGFTGGFRLWGYYLLLFLVFAAAIAIVVLLVILTSSIPALAVLIAVLGWVAVIVMSILVAGRLCPMTSQVALHGGALSWTWNATRGRFWAVLGRYLLWAIVAGVIGQIVIGIVIFPFSLLVAASASGGAAAVTWATLLLYAVSLVLSMVVTALTYIGVVPIWRDLTDDPDYRSIADGQPLPEPV